jgi:hypothetical protein
LPKCIKKERNSTKALLTRRTCYFKYIPGDYLMKLVERMPRVCKPVIRGKGGYIEESQIQNIFLFV